MGCLRIILTLIALVFCGSLANAGLLGGASPGAIENARILAKQWTKTLGGNSGEYGGKIAIDSNGNIFVVGSFDNNSSNVSSITDFASNPLNGKTTTLSQDVYVAKLNSAGGQQWIRVLGGTSYDAHGDVAVDPTGNVYIIGSYYNTTADANAVKDFAGVALPGKTAWASRDVFAAKLNSSGTQQWIRTLGGTNTDNGVAIYANSTSIIVAGTYTNRLNDGNQVKTFSGGVLLGLTSSQSDEIFIASFNSSGTQQWIKKLGGSGFDSVGDVHIDSFGSVYICGAFNNNISDSNTVFDFAGASLLGASASNTFAVTDAFIAKLSSAGAQNWIKVLGGEGYDSATSLATDGTNVYLTGTYTNDSTNTNSVVDFSGSPLNGKGTFATSDIFLSKLNAADGTQSWVKAIGGSDEDYGSYVAIDPDKNIYVAGNFQNDISNTKSVSDFTGGILKGKSSTVDFHSFLIKLNPIGQPLWVKISGGEISGAYTSTRAIATDPEGNVITSSDTRNNLTNDNSVRDFSGVRVNGKSGTITTDFYLSRINGKW